MELIIDDKNRVRTISLNRPEAHNALNQALIEDILKAIAEAEKGATRALVFKAEGKSFCAGGDLKWMQDTLDESEQESKANSQLLANMYEAIWRYPGSVFALVHGNVMGGGLGLVAVCDWVFAETNTSFCFSETKLGLVPSIIAPYVLNKCGGSTILPYMTTAKAFSATEAHTLGLVHALGEMDQGQNLLNEWINALHETAPEAVDVTKQLIRELGTSKWDAQREKTISLNATRRRSAEGQEGMRAFFDKRDPSWRKP